MLAVPSPLLDLDVLEQGPKLPAKPDLPLEHLTLTRSDSSPDPHRRAPSSGRRGTRQPASALRARWGGDTTATTRPATRGGDSSRRASRRASPKATRRGRRHRTGSSKVDGHRSEPSEQRRRRAEEAHPLKRAVSTTGGAGASPRNAGEVRLITRIPPALIVALGVLTMGASLFALLTLRARRARQAAEHAALTDRLTGLANRPAFDHRLAVEWERATRYQRPLGVVVVDLDDFKAVNDTHGHAAGDEVLRQVGASLARRVRTPDLAARLGGDEFVVIAPETSAGGLVRLAEVLRGVVEELPVSVSVGWTERKDEDEEPAAMLIRADEAMYEEKELRKGTQRRVSVTAPTVAVGARLGPEGGSSRL